MTTPNTPDTAGQDKWERWWAGLDGTPGEIVWDAGPADLDADLCHFAGTFNPALPVVDLGCGDGRQTRFLAAHFPHVTGTDLSASAIGRARAAGNPRNVAFQVLDARDTGGAARLHDQLGDANVYIRGVLQTLAPASRPRAVETIAALLGRTGTLFAKELPPEASSYFAEMTQRYGIPPGLAKVMQTIPPGQISLSELSALFPADRFEVLDTGTSHMRTVNSLPGGVTISVPAIWILSRPRRGCFDGFRVSAGTARRVLQDGQPLLGADHDQDVPCLDFGPGRGVCQERSVPDVIRPGTTTSSATRWRPPAGSCTSSRIWLYKARLIKCRKKRSLRGSLRRCR